MHRKAHRVTKTHFARRDGNGKVEAGAGDAAGDGGGKAGGGFDGSVDLERDRRLVERCQRGDPRTFDELYRRYHRRLTLFCLRRLGEPHEAEDAAQEAFSRAWRALPTFGGMRRFYPWLTVIAANVCTDILRRRSSHMPVGDVPEPRPFLTLDGGVEDKVVSEIDGAMAMQALRRLSPRYQRVLALRESSGCSSQSIADREGISVPAVETLLWRARQALKKEFAQLADACGKLGVAILVSGWVLLQRLGRHLSPRTACRTSQRLFAWLPGAPPAPIVPSVALVGSTAVTAALLLGSASSAPTREAMPSPPAIGARQQPALNAARNGSGSAASASSPPSITGNGSPPQLTGPVPRPATPAGAPPPLVSAPGLPVNLGQNALASQGSASLGPASASIPGLAGTTSTALQRPQGGLDGTVNGATSSIGPTLGDVGNTVNGATSGVASKLNAAPGAVAGVTSGATGTVSGVASVLNAAASTVNGVTNTLGSPPTVNVLAGTLGSL